VVGGGWEEEKDEEDDEEEEQEEPRPYFKHMEEYSNGPPNVLRSTPSRRVK
jgi:hypothetical protein